MPKSLHNDAVATNVSLIAAPCGPQFRCGSVVIWVRRFAGGQHVIRVTGELLGNAVVGLAELIAGELAQQPTLLTLDLSEVTRIDAAGADLVASASTLASEQNPSSILFTVAEPVQSIPGPPWLATAGGHIASTRVS